MDHIAYARKLAAVINGANSHSKISLEKVNAPEPKMQLLTKELLDKLPPLYSENKTALVKFFNPSGAGTWYASEYSPEERLFFGVAHIHCAEYGYFSLDELESFTGPFGLGIERDLHFQPRPLSEILEEHESDY